MQGTCTVTCCPHSGPHSMVSPSLRCVRWPVDASTAGTSLHMLETIHIETNSPVLSHPRRVFTSPATCWASSRRYSLWDPTRYRSSPWLTVLERTPVIHPGSYTMFRRRDRRFERHYNFFSKTQEMIHPQDALGIYTDFSNMS